MRWPWTSKARLDELRQVYESRLSELRQAHADHTERLDGEVQWLRERNEQLLDALTRVRRHEVGMYEQPRAEKPKGEMMPKPLQDYINGFSNPSLKKQMRDQALKRHHSQGEPWDDIMADMLPEEPAEEESEPEVEEATHYGA